MVNTGILLSHELTIGGLGWSRWFSDEGYGTIGPKGRSSETSFSVESRVDRHYKLEDGRPDRQ